VVDDDDLGEVRVMRDYSQWTGSRLAPAANMRAAGRDTDTVLREIGRVSADD